jgi:hypothetical protein
MNRRIFAATFAMVASVFATSAIASPLAVHTPTTNAAFSPSRDRMVTVNLRNDSAEPITLNAGDNSVTLAPGKITPVRVAVGTRLTADNTTPHYAAGTLIVVVDANLDKATLSFK